MKYFLTDKQKNIFASNAQKLVECMCQNDTEYSVANKEFMEMYAMRKFVFCEMVINTSNEEKFVESLLKNGLVKKHKTPKELLLGLFY